MCVLGVWTRHTRRTALRDASRRETLTLSSAESSDLFGHDQMCFTLTAIVGIDPSLQFVGPQQTVWFRDGPLPMNPCRFNRVKPRTFAGQGADDDAYTACAPFDVLIVLAYPVAHGLAAVPGRVVPDQQQGGEALHRQLGAAPRQERDRDRTHGTSCDKPEPPLLGLLRLRSHQHPITGQGLGIRISRRRGALLQLRCGLGVWPALLIRLREPAPPDFVLTAQGPRGLGHRLLDQAVAPFFFRR